MECGSIVNLLVAGYGPLVVAIAYLFRELVRTRQDQLTKLERALEKLERMRGGTNLERAKGIVEDSA